MSEGTVRDLTRVLGVLLWAAGSACLAGFVLAVVLNGAWALAIAYTSLLALYVINVILRRLAGRLGVEQLWSVPSQEKLSAARFHVSALIVLICLVALQLFTNPLARRLAAGVRVALLVGALAVGVAYLVDLVYELRSEREYEPPPRDLRRL
jgi:uncharacterized membrane protein (DUF485 family)